MTGHYVYIAFWFEEDGKRKELEFLDYGKALDEAEKRPGAFVDQIWEQPNVSY